MCACVSVCARARWGVGVPVCCCQLLTLCSAWRSCWQCFLSLSFLSPRACPQLTLTVSLETCKKGPARPACKAGTPASRHRYPESPVQDKLALCAFSGLPQASGDGTQEGCWAWKQLPLQAAASSHSQALPSHSALGRILGPPPTPQVGKPILFQGLWQAPSQRFLREPVSDSCT